MTAKSLTVNWSIPSYPTYWLGIEDIRFCNESTILFACPEKNPSGNPCMFRGILEESSVHSIVRCEPSVVEKNWMPFTYNTESSVIYTVSPFQIKSILTDTKTVISLPDTLELNGYHGSTNGIPYKDNSRLFLIHINKERTFHKWLLFYPETNQIQCSKPFVFFQYSYIEFPCSLCEYNGMLYVSLGVNDDKAYILTIEKDDVNNSLLLSTF
jgi:hypothetical protein